MLVAGLFLDEPRVPAVLDQVSDIGPAEGVEVQAVIQAQGLAIGDEAGVQPLAPDPRPALRRPGRRVAAGPEQRADLGEPLLQNLRSPVPYGQHAAAPGWRALLRLAEPYPAQAELAELGPVRVAAEVRGVQHPRLVAPQRTSRRHKRS